MSILLIDNSSVHRITSGQVIVALENVVKETVENALDAGATSVEVRFKDYGLESVETIDNGTGIRKEDIPFTGWSKRPDTNLALQHHTSKLSSFEQLSRVTTLGFRGEALASIAATSTLSIVTSTAEDVPKGSKVTFSQDGKVENITLVPAKIGTTTSVDGLFSRLPVRRKEFERNKKREFAKSIHLLQCYATVCVGVKFLVTNVSDKRFALLEQYLFEEIYSNRNRCYFVCV